MKVPTEAKKALTIAMGASVFSKEFTDQWSIQKGSATRKEDAERICNNFKNTGFFTKLKTSYFDGTPLTFWVAIKRKPY